MTDEAIEKPLPLPDEASQPFWDGAERGELLLMRCDDCGAFRLPSRKHCDRCLSEAVSWERVSGHGTVRTFGIMHQRYHPAFAAEIPYNVTIVELDEGPQITTNLVGIENADIRVGMAVTVEWERHADVTLPKFRPA